MSTFSGDLLRDARKAAGLSRQEVANRVCAQLAQMIETYETGRRSPSISTLARLADAIGVEPCELFADDDSDA